MAKAVNPFLSALAAEQRLKKLRSGDSTSVTEEDVGAYSKAPNPFLAALEAEAELKKSREDEDAQREYEDAERQAIADKKAGKDKGKDPDRGIADTIGNLFFEKSAQLVNLTGEGLRGAAGLASIGRESVLGTDESYERKVNEVWEDNMGEKADERNRSGGLFKAGTGFKTADEINEMSAGDTAKGILGRGLGTGAEVIPLGRGYQAAANAAKGAKTASVLARGAAEGAIVGGVAGVGEELIEDDGLQAEDILRDAAFGGATGAVGAGLGRMLNKGRPGADDPTAKPTDPTTPTATDIPTDRPAFDVDGRPIDPNNPLQQRLDEIDARIAEYAPTESGARPIAGTAGEHSPEELRSLVQERKEVMDELYGRQARPGAVDDVTDTAGLPEGEVLEGDIIPPSAITKFDATQKPRMIEKGQRQLRDETEGIASIRDEDIATQPKLDMENPRERNAVEAEVRAIDSVLEPATDYKNLRKANLLDYVITPIDALKRIGLGKTADTVEQSFEKYRVSDVKSARQIESWRTELGDEESARRIFHALDGDEVELVGGEQKIFDEIKEYLSKYADDLGLEEKDRVSDYITHVFDDVIKGDSVDATYAQILRKNNKKTDLNTAQYLEGKVTGKVNDPNLKSRESDRTDYSDDLFRVLDIYTRRANRKIHMEPAVKAISNDHANVDARTARYLEKLNNAITLKPDRLDQFFDDAVGSLTGDKFGPNSGTRALRAWRQNVYRSTLGLNFGSALRNITQLTNTFAEVPMRDFGTGVSKALRSLANKTSGGQDDFWDEMIEAGIFDDAIHKQDSNMGVIKRGLEKADPTLFVFFNTAERINRGATYAAGKSHAMRKLNMSEPDAIKYAQGLVSKTQFKFNSVETPLMFNNQIAKTLTQFASYPVRQAGYMGRMGKNAITKEDGTAGLNPTEIAKLVKWTGANLAVAATLGELMGFDFKDSLPNLTGLRDLKSPTTQFVFGDKTKAGLKDVLSGKDAFGNTPVQKDEDGNAILDEAGNPVPDYGELAKGFAGDQFGIVVPGGAQIKKTAEGMETASRGTSETDNGGIRFETNSENDLQSAVFGQYSTPEARDFYADKANKALSEGQSDMVREVDPVLRGEYVNFFRALSQTPTKKDAIGKKVDKAVANREYERAARLAAGHNAQVNAILEDLKASVGGEVSPELEDYLNSQYVVNYEYYRKKKRTTE